ncbi:hypothetical protein EJ419_07350 [Alloscardovia theropitheci]|uniref:Uncharacterized protein n=1 Tax=Alloscardovia theropitheci TaxID=2496842 RepID=A0A4R0QNM3_9BIFI|nr:hypothetical protein [Alloscardovia theropitheci]TCD53774.1 hypothetical protein EJ419_07350 [Alloscardovia theropitheci]
MVSHSLSYRSGCVNRRFELNGPALFGGTVESLRSGEWSYKNKGRYLQKRYKNSQTRTITLSAIDKQVLQDFLDTCDADVENNTPATLVADDCETLCFIVKDEAKHVSPLLAQTELTVLLIDGVWREPIRQSYTMDIVDQTGLDYDYDYSLVQMNGDITNPQLVTLDCDLTIYGPVTNPQISIANNVYQVSIDVPDTYRLSIDSREKTVILIDSLGTSRNVLDNASFVDGKNIFAPVPPGSHPVLWSNEFDFDVTLWVKKGRLPWTI